MSLDAGIVKDVQDGGAHSRLSTDISLESRA
jgi:hypothetical protein